ncbi:MAG: glycosyltransferase family protein [Pseudomonadales bacterium]
MPAKILFYVQYLLGIGHVRRSALIIDALVAQGAQVDVIFGGVDVPGIQFSGARVHRLTPIKSADAAFSALVKHDGSEFSEADKHERSLALLDICERVQPDLIVTETYPFGRRQMRFELLPLLAWVREQESPPVLVASIRDILQQRSQAREDECLALIAAHYQHVLVHGDERFLPLETSFPKADAIADKLSYSGYVCPRYTGKKVLQPSIVVSIGGGSVGREILDAALALNRSGYAWDKHWTLITGPNMDAADKAYFKGAAGGNVSVVDMADNFLQLLANAEVSISMAGYNTVMDLLQVNTPAVVIPFEGSGETEQRMRSQALESSGVLQSVSWNELSADTLAQAMQRAIASYTQGLSIRSDGAKRSAQMLMTWAGVEQ